MSPSHRTNVVGHSWCTPHCSESPGLRIRYCRQDTERAFCWIYQSRNALRWLCLFGNFHTLASIDRTFLGWWDNRHRLVNILHKVKKEKAIKKTSYRRRQTAINLTLGFPVEFVPKYKLVRGNNERQTSLWAYVRNWFRTRSCISWSVNMCAPAGWGAQIQRRAKR